MNSAAEWVASIPDQLTARDALVYIETALQDADAATKEIVSRFTGTVPPPPWPQHPELRKAIDALEGGRLMLNQAIRLGHGEAPQPKSGPTGIRLQNAGQALYREVAVMQQNLKGVTPGELAAAAAGLAARAVRKVAETKIGGLVFLGVALYLLHQVDADAD